MTTGKYKKRLGDEGEDLAVAFLQQKGFTILTRNYRARQAEIDIICEDGSAGVLNRELVFVEVKTRTSASHGSPIESITPEKLRHVARAAKYYLYEQGIEDRNCRFDIIGIQIGEGEPEIEYIQDVVEY